MSWVDDMRCLYCDGKLPLYRKITSGQFCSTAHRRAYWQDQERLGVERLHQTHNSLRAYRPPGSVEAILGHADPGFQQNDSQISQDIRELARTASNTDRVCSPGFLKDPALVLRSSEFASDPSAHRSRVMPLDWSAEAATRYLVEGIPLHQSTPCLAHIGTAGAVNLPSLTDKVRATSDFLIENVPVRARGAAEPLPSTTHPIINVAHNAKPETDELLGPAEQMIPQCDRMLAIPMRAVPSSPASIDIDISFERPDGLPIVMIVGSDAHVETSAQLVDSKSLAAIVRELAPAGLVVLTPGRPAAGVWCLSSEPVDLKIAARPASFDVVKSGDRCEEFQPAATGMCELTLDPAAARLPENASPAKSEPRPVSLNTASSSAALETPRFSGVIASILEPMFAGLSSLSAGDTGRDCAGRVSAANSPLDTAEFSASAPVMETLGADGRFATAASAQPVQAGLRRLTLDHIPLVHGIWTDQVRGIDFAAGSSAPALLLSTPAHRPRLALASGSALSVMESSDRAQSRQIPAGEAALPVSRVEPAKLSTAAPQIPASPAIAVPPCVPGLGGVKRLSFTIRPVQPAASAPSAPEIFTLAQPPKAAPVRPRLKLDPINSTPLADEIAAASESASHSFTRLGFFGDSGKMPSWTQARELWQQAPRDLKMLVFAIPILLGLALHPRLPKVRVTAPQTNASMPQGFKKTLDEQLVNVKQTVAERAAVALDEDFRSGLDDWTSRGDMTTTWSFDENGFVKPGLLAVYQPSMGLTDYQMQFLGIIDQKALSWVVRAVDYDNYYVVKLVVLKPGPMPTIGITRYAVINGKAEDRADTIVPINARADMLYRVQMDLNGDRFVLSVQGQLVDSWSDARLKRGGIGFFSARGEESRLRWVQVTHQYDMLGRLCAYLAPYNIPSTNGSW